MNLHHSIRRLAFAVPLLAIAALGPPAYAGSVSYVFNVPARTGVLPVARVKVRLEGLPLDTTVSLNGTALTLPGFANVPHTGFATSDTVKSTFAGGVLILDIATDSLLGAKPCQILSTFSTSAAYTIGLSEPAATPASTFYQITFYSSQSENVTDTGCLTRVRRIPMSAAGLWTSVPAGTDLGRAPIDTVLVIDESGSMLSPITSGQPSKWSLTVEAIKEFVTVLAAESNIADRLGMVFYDDTVRKITTKASGPCTDPVTHASVLCWFDKLEFGQVTSEISKPLPTHPHGGMTSIGGGLAAALPDAATSFLAGKDSMIVLMSDGLQNTSPCLVPDASSIVTIAPTGACPGATAGSPIIDPAKPVPVLGIAIGLPPGSASPLLLQAITDQTAKTDSTWDLLANLASGTYGDTLVQELKGNTLQVGAQNVATLAAADNNGATIPATFDKSIKRVVASLGWLPQPGKTFALALQVKAPGAADWTTINSTTIPGIGTTGNLAFVAPPSVAQGSPYLIVVAFDMTDALAGDWQFRVSRRSDHPGDVPYHFRAYTVEKSLDFQLRLQPGRHGTGQPLVLNADVSFDGKPMTGIGNALQVAVEGPNGPIGTLLHDRPDPGTPDGGVTEPKADPFEKKLSNLMASDDFVAKAGTRSTGQVLSLTEVGNGRYSIQLNDTKLPGGYKFHFALDTTGPSGHLRRVEDVTTQVEALPDPTATTITVNPSGNGAFTVVITPFDKFGNYVGPGFGQRVRVTLPPGQGDVAATVDPRVDGTYVVQLSNVPPGVDPQVTISVNETQIAQGPLSKLPEKSCPPTGCGACTGGAAGVRICLPVAGLFMGALIRRRRRRR